MVVRKRKKSKRMRGSGTHGYGSKKKHRGAGSRGGRGKAGQGKRGQQNRPGIWKKKILGKYGFKRNVPEPEIRSINLVDIELKLNDLIDKDFVNKKQDIFEIDLKKMGYDKLLGKGRVTHKFEIEAKNASKKAIQKVEEAGGKVVLPKQED